MSVLRSLDDSDANLRGKIIAIYVVLIAANVAAWAWALIAFHNHPVLLATCLLAYSFGLRHAVDADHIAAIDNATRKLMQEGKRPIARRASTSRSAIPPWWCWRPSASRWRPPPSRTSSRASRTSAA